MKKLFAALIATGLAGGAIPVIDNQAAYADALTTGSLRGVVRDKSSGEVAVGATVVATSAALQGEQVVIADESGGYYITSLPPGIYTLNVYYNDTTFARSNVLVQVGKEAVVNITIDSAASKGETINIAGTAPIVDQGSTKTGSTITSDFTRNVPTGRTFGAVMESTGGAQGDTYGISFSGATSAENTYVVEGLNTTDTGFGTLSSNLPNEFIQETEVITGGYNAEFGRATGAIVNVVTKTGSNAFHGSVFGHIQPSGLTAASDRILRQGTAIDREINQNYQFDVGGELGGPIIKDKLWFHVGFTPTFEKTTTTRIVNTNVDRVNNDTGAAGADNRSDVDPVTGFTIREEVARRDLITNSSTYFFTAKLTGAISSNHQWQVTGFGNPESAEGPITGTVHDPNTMNGTAEEGAYDVSGKWTSKFNEGKTQFDAVIGYHNGFNNVAPANAATDTPGIRYNYTRSLYDFVDVEGQQIAACKDGTPANPDGDPFPTITNCPVANYVDGGAGFLENRTNNRTSLVFAVTQRVKAAGQHVFKAGIDTEFSTYDSGRRFSGGAFLVRGINDPGRRDFTIRQYLKYDAAGPITCGADTDGDGVGNSKCSVIDTLSAETNDRSIAGYIQDSWQIRPNLTLNAGVRVEQQIGYVAKFLQGTTAPDTGEQIPDVGFKLDNLIAPRVGFIFDPTQEGKSKIFGHWGRFYENIPMDMNVRAFGGETTFEGITGLNADGEFDGMNCNFDHSTPNLAQAVLGCEVGDQQTLGGTIAYVAPGMKGQYIQELILGAEYEVVSDMTVGANFIHRSMPVVIEDMSTDGGTNYLIGNPSFNYDDEAAKLDAQAMTLMSGSEADQALAALYRSRASQLRAVKHFDPPSRDYNAVEIKARKRPTGNSLLLASYTYSRAMGNYPGLFSTETGQLDPNITSMYDLPDLMPNRYGPSGLDRPHNLKVDGFYAFDLKRAGLVVLGASFRAQSGIPHNTLAAHPIYGGGESYLLPRGALYRSPATTQLDTHFSYGYQVNKTTRVEGFIDIFNLFNSQAELDVDEIYTTNPSLPIVGGDEADLAHAKLLSGRPSKQQATVVNKNLNYGKLTTHQSPLTGQLGFRLTF